MVPYYLPLGFDIMYQAMTVCTSAHFSLTKKHNNRNANLDLLKKWMGETRSTTFQVRSSARIAESSLPHPESPKS